jgi:hypothetical protein
MAGTIATCRLKRQSLLEVVFPNFRELDLESLLLECALSARRTSPPLVKPPARVFGNGAFWMEMNKLKQYLSLLLCLLISRNGLPQPDSKTSFIPPG